MSESRAQLICFKDIYDFVTHPDRIYVPAANIAISHFILKRVNESDTPCLLTMISKILSEKHLRNFYDLLEKMTDEKQKVPLEILRFICQSSEHCQFLLNSSSTNRDIRTYAELLTALNQNNALDNETLFMIESNRTGLLQFFKGFFNKTKTKEQINNMYYLLKYDTNLISVICELINKFTPEHQILLWDYYKIMSPEPLEVLSPRRASQSVSTLPLRKLSLPFTPNFFESPTEEAKQDTKQDTPDMTNTTNINTKIPALSH